MKIEFTTEQNAALIEAYRSGRSIVSLSEKYGVATTVITRILREEGVTLRRAGAPAKPVDTVLAERTAELMAEGLSLHQAALATGVPYTSFRRRLGLTS